MDEEVKEEFFTSCQEGILETVKKVVKETGIGQLAGEKKDGGDSGIHVAAKEGRAEVVSFLMRKGWPVDQQGSFGLTALHHAAQHGHLSTCRVLIRARAKVRVKASNGDEPIHRASHGGHAEVIELLLKSGALLTDKGYKGQTPLHHAARRGHREAVDFLLSQGADKTEKDADGMTPVDYAKTLGLSNVADLIEKGSNSTENQSGSGSASRRRNLKKQHAIDDDDMTHDTSAKQSHSSLPPEHQSDAGSSQDDNTPDPIDEDDMAHGTPPSQSRSSPSLEHQSNDGSLHDDTSPDPTDEDGNDDDYSQNQESEDEISATHTFMQQDSQPSTSSRFGFNRREEYANQRQTVDPVADFLDACKKGRLIKVKELVEREGLDVNEAKDGCGWTGLHFAAWMGHRNVVEFLLEQGAKVDHRDGAYASQTPLHLASWNGHEPVVRLLMDEGADPRKKDDYDETPAQLAKDEGHVSLAQVIQEEEKLVVTCGLKHERGDAKEKVKEEFLYACREGLLKVVKNKVETKDIEELMEWKDNLGDSGIHHASCKGRDQVVSYLLSAGWDVKQKGWLGCTPLHRAAEYGHLSTCEILIAQDEAAVKDRDSNGDQPIHSASAGGHVEIVELLLEKGAKTEDRGWNNQTPLHRAALDGHLDVVLFLMSKEADTLAEDADGNLPLHWAKKVEKAAVVHVLEVNPAKEFLDACKKGSLAKVADWVVAKGLDVNEVKDDCGWTGLHFAAWMGQLDVVKFLIDQGAMVDQAEGAYSSQTPLHLAVWNDQHHVVRFLLGRGADPKKQDDYEETPEELAVKIENTPIIQEFREHKEQRDFLQACRDGCMDEVRKAVKEKGVEALQDIKTECGDNGIHIAAKEGKLEVVKYLMREKWRVDEQGGWRWTALHRAARAGHLPVCQLLIKEGATVNLKDLKGDQPIHCAAMRGHTDIVKLLLKKGANVKDAGWNSQTVLHIVARTDNVNLARFLISKGASSMVKNGNGKTALDLAKEKGDEGMISVLDGQRHRKLSRSKTK